MLHAKACAQHLHPLSSSHIGSQPHARSHMTTQSPDDRIVSAKERRQFVPYGTTGGGRTYTSGTVYGGHGGTASYSGYTYTPRTRGVIGMTSITSYTRVFTMDIFDMNKSTTDNFHKVFEGTANSVGSTNDLSVVSGCLINTLFKGFPGKNGERIKDFTLLANCDR